MASELAAWAGVIVGLGSLVVAIIAFRKSSAAQHRIIEIEEQRDHERKTESLQASLRPELRKTGKHTHRLYLVNEGACDARNIQVEMDGKPLSEHPAAVKNAPMPDLVGPKGEIGCILGLHMQCTPPFKLKVTWDDDFENNRTYQTTLTW